jgi:hypothetical protein
MLCVLLLFLSTPLIAQFYEYGHDAGKLHWSRFSTPHYRLIFPVGVDSLARVFAARIEAVYPYLGEPLDHAHSRMPVVIHNESSFSNGLHVWAPKRLEIFTNPDPNAYNQDWLTQLALHEGRHAVQIDKLNQGFTRGLYYVGGEQLVGAMAIFLPFWYLEGDAVDAETRLSTSGRGRQPSFEMGLKAQMLEKGKVYSFSKATMGSFKHYIPNHYELGYLMVRYGRRQYTDRFWIDFQQYAARKPFLLDPTWFSMKQYGLRSKSQFYREALKSYRAHWSGTDSMRMKTPFTEWAGAGIRCYTSYRYPHRISPSLVFALKTGMDQIPEFIFLEKDGEEHRVFRPGFLNSGRVSFSGTHVVWDEFVPDTRWSNRNYSVIRTYEIASGKTRNLGKRTRYYSPAVSGDGSRVAAIEQSVYQKFSLVILDMDGRVLQKVPSPGGSYIQQPAWMEKDSALVMIRSGAEGESLVSYHPSSGSWRSLFQAGKDDISHPVVSGNRIYFSATFTGIDNIFCHDLLDGGTYQVTSERFGAFQPWISTDRKDLFYSRYTSEGYRISELSLSEGMWKKLQLARDHAEQMDYEPTEKERTVLDALAGIDTLFLSDSTAFRVEKYNKAFHLFHFHSWLPLYVDYLNPSLILTPGHQPVSPGISLISQNHLSTAVSQLGYEYRDGYHRFHSGIKLKGRYPVLNLFLDYGGEPEVLLYGEEADTAMALPRYLGFTAQTYVPIRFNTGKYLSIVQPRIDYMYRKDLQYIEESATYRTGAHYLYYRLDASLYLRLGMKDILPRLGLHSHLGYYHAPFDNRVTGALSIFGLTAYLPGLLKHQTLRLSVQHQVQYPLDRSHPEFINLLTLPRGHHGIFGEVLTRTTADYVFPILYPDLELTSLLYVKRIRGNIWADHMKGSNVIIHEPSPHFEDRIYNSLGVDLLFDVNLLRIPFPLSVGGRFIYDPGTGRSDLEWLYSIQIN